MLDSLNHSTSKASSLTGKFRQASCQSCFHFLKSPYNKNATKPRINIFKLPKPNRGLEKLAVKQLITTQTKKINARWFVAWWAWELEGELPSTSSLRVLSTESPWIWPALVAQCPALAQCYLRSVLPVPSLNVIYKAGCPGWCSKKAVQPNLSLYPGTTSCPGH